MERRKFLQQSTLAGISTLALGALGYPSQAAGSTPAPGAGENTFRLNYAPHDGMFKNSGGSSFTDQIKYMHDQGFRAIEDNGLLGRPVAEQEKIGALLNKLGMQMGVFVVDTGNNWKTSLASGKQEFKDAFVKTCKDSVEAAKRVNAKWATVVPGFFDRSLPMGVQTAHVLDALRKGAEIFEPHGLIMVLEPLSDTPELFLRTAEQSFEICKAVNSPSCKILYDIYHMQRNTGNLIPIMDLCWDEIAYIQIGDNPGRKEPGTGEINYKNIFKHLHKKGYKGVLGMEHGVAGKGQEGEAALIRAYREADNFM
ncbi:hydroxypyruvate isomerase family protein [Chitinophaga nivalis]|uniref:TIM barrel protein n=1 Tax=Chitinophaga nivalis TaxID=2991709 RepID=A0ABT3IVC1_9BACT|nr:TIM barrel protein [Chitinophaga nivalis]MCW3462357.1 TIM barrel protein [Chitinophaga nivalis]MCW3487952.1 TIM barrel protein [Chitinophaga nivalis]